MHKTEQERQKGLGTEKYRVARLMYSVYKLSPFPHISGVQRHG